MEAVVQQCALSPQHQQPLAAGERRHAFGEEDGEVEGGQANSYGEKPSFNVPATRSKRTRCSFI